MKTDYGYYVQYIAKKAAGSIVLYTWKKKS